MKHVFIMNDTKRYHDFIHSIKDIMKDYDVTYFYSHSVEESQDYIHYYPTKARFYAVGGDGAIHTLVQALVNTKHELVVIPYGTGNDFCRTLTSIKDPKELLKKSLTMDTIKVDTIQINDRYYINSACFAIDSVIANHVHDTPNIPLVPQSKSYIISILQQVFSYPFYHVCLKSEGKTLYEGKVTLCTLMNGQYYGGGFQITQNALIDDGYFDVCIVDEIPKRRIPYMVSLLVRHQIEKRKEVHFFSLKEATLSCEYIGNLDGEQYQSDHYDFKIVPQSLNLVPYDYSSNISMVSSK